MARRLTDTERRLWTHVTRHVRPAPGRRHEPLEDEPAAKPASAAASTAIPAKPARRHPRPTPVSPPADVSSQRRIRRGQVAVDARLDLHGLTHDQAFSRLAHFLTSEQAHGSRCVLVITGKGRAGGGLLRSRLSDWLAAPDLRPLVSGYSTAHLRHGGEGAFYVLLKAKRAPAHT